jgi:hypothetical protein
LSIPVTALTADIVGTRIAVHSNVRPERSASAACTGPPDDKSENDVINASMVRFMRALLSQ